MEISSVALRMLSCWLCTALVPMLWFGFIQLGGYVSEVCTNGSKRGLQELPHSIIKVLLLNLLCSLELRIMV